MLGVSAQTVARRYRRLCADSGLRVVGRGRTLTRRVSPSGWYG
ncbi:hypothetical protein [Streptomyces canus]